MTEQEIDLVESERMEFLIAKLKNECGLSSIKLVRAPPNYFDLSLDERMDVLGAPSKEHLCKTIVM